MKIIKLFYSTYIFIKTQIKKLEHIINYITILNIFRVFIIAFIISIINFQNEYISQKLGSVTLYHDSNPAYTYDDNSFIKQLYNINGVDSVAPVLIIDNPNFVITAGYNDKYLSNSQIIGIDFKNIDNYNYTLVSGRFPQNDDNQYIALTDEKFEHSFSFIEPTTQYSSNKININPLNSKITLKFNNDKTNHKLKENIKIIGIIKNDANCNSLPSNSLIIDINYLIKLLKKSHIDFNNIEYSYITINCSSINYLETITTFSKHNGYVLSQNNTEILESQNKINFILITLFMILVILAIIFYSFLSLLAKLSYVQMEEFKILLYSLGCNKKDFILTYCCSAIILSFLSSFISVFFGEIIILTFNTFNSSFVKFIENQFIISVTPMIYAYIFLSSILIYIFVFLYFFKNNKIITNN